MNKVCAITILYLGQELTDEAARALKDVLINFNIISFPKNCTIVYKDSEGIADSLIEKASAEIKPVAVVRTTEPVVAAVSHVGKMFKEDLEIAKTSKNYAPFIVHVIQSATDDYTLQRSIDIIASSKIPPTLLRQYGLTDKAVSAIKSIKVV